MARIFYVSEKNRGRGYTQINFFKTEKEALEYGISEWPDFDMFGDPDSKEDSYDEDNNTWWEGEDIDLRGDGLLMSWEEDRVYLQTADDEEARKFLRSSKHWKRGSAIFFDSFKKGMYGILGNRTLEGKGYTWTFENGKVNESITTMSSFDKFLKESKIQIKRKYTENHPAKTVGKAAKIRNKMLEAAADGKITKEEFDAILREMSTDTGRWMRRNSKYFNVSEESVGLSKTGQRILNELQKELVVNEKASVFTMANARAEEKFGEFGIATLDFDELGQIIDIKKADKIAKRKFGEEGFMSLTEVEMEELLEKNPKLLKENKTNKTMENKFIFESFGDFEASLNEAFKSTKFSQLFMQTSRYSGKKSFNKDLVKAFYSATKIDLSRIEDEDILTSDPQTVYKNKTSDTIVFYISDNAKENPYAPYDSYGENKNIPGGGYLLAMTTGRNEFYGVEWSRYGSRNRTLAKRDNNSGDTVGISKKYKGWDGTGLYNVKRIAEVADRAVVLNIALLKQKYSTAELRASREDARKGATAFKSAKDFKSENNARYAKILADKASKLPLDKMVKDAIDALGTQIQDGLSKGEKTEYGEIKIGENPRGRAVKLTDAASHMSSILSDYERYVSYIKQAEESEARYGERESYYERESKDYAKRVKDKIDKIEVFNYAW